MTCADLITATGRALASLEDAGPVLDESQRGRLHRALAALQLEASDTWDAGEREAGWKQRQRWEALEPYVRMFS